MTDGPRAAVIGAGSWGTTVAALVARNALGVAMGGEPLTFAGLTGMGDLVATCCSPQSRNRRVGMELGRGRTLAEIVAETSMVAEGVRTTRAVLELAERHDVEMPIAEQVGLVLDGVRHPADGVLALMLREPEPERHEAPA